MQKNILFFGNFVFFTKSKDETNEKNIKTINLIENLLFLTELVQIKHVYQVTHGNILKLPKAIKLPPELMPKLTEDANIITDTNSRINNNINTNISNNPSATDIAKSIPDKILNDSWNDDDKYMTIDFNVKPMQQSQKQSKVEQKTSLIQKISNKFTYNNSNINTTNNSKTH